MIAVVYVQLKAFFVGQSSKANPQAVGVLRVMVEYNRFFEKAGMKRVDYKRDESPLEERIRSSTDVQGFDFYLGKSRGYCQGSFEGLNVRSREELLGLLGEFSRQPFIKN